MFYFCLPTLFIPHLMLLYMDVTVYVRSVLCRQTNFPNVFSKILIFNSMFTIQWCFLFVHSSRHCDTFHSVQPGRHTAKSVFYQHDTSSFLQQEYGCTALAGPQRSAISGLPDTLMDFETEMEAGRQNKQSNNIEEN